MEAVIIGFHLDPGESVFSGNPFRRVALWTGRQGDSSLVDGGVGVDLGLDPMDAVAGGAGRRIAPSPCGQDTVDAFRKLLCHFGMAGPAGLGDIRPEDRGLGVNHRPKLVTPVTACTGHFTGLFVNASQEEFPGGRTRAQGMLSCKLLVRMALAARGGDV